MQIGRLVDNRVLIHGGLGHWIDSLTCQQSSNLTCQQIMSQHVGIKFCHSRTDCLTDRKINGVTGRLVKVNSVTGRQVKVNEVIGRQVEVNGVTGRQVEVIMESLVAGSISIQSDLSTCRWSSNLNGRQMIFYWSQFSIQFNSFILSKPCKQYKRYIIYTCITYIFQTV